MEPPEYKSFYEKMGSVNGWDFSRLNVRTVGEQWDFYEEVTKRCRKTDLWLDIGCGGGEKLLPIAESALLLVGIDLSQGMIRTAQANALKANEHRARFLQMDAGSLEFPAGFFHIVSCRQSEFSAQEAARVLAEGGIFLTQQIGEHDKRNIKQAFQRGQQFGMEDGELKHKYISDLTEAGFSDIQSFEYDAAEYYQTDEDLVFLLKHTPIIPDFGAGENDFDILHAFIERGRTEQGIMTNSKRFMIIAKK